MQCEIRLTIARAWWLTPALIAIGVFAAARGRLPDDEWLSRFVMRGLRIRVEEAR
ncbi:hypothetical protein phiE131_068 [Burkholderia phage phiE131]|uniref:hypothetical protein n=1 Tax=Burkholderia thailandensis TaxID=57975 RepID=UPI000EF31DBD|nr:hypothetical protein [Burkholderia thailandensis]AYJ74334.1 hypothetical protein phiE131_068 [Burkholderia phage phiE131]AYJ74404.1 hypothetical protein phiE058_068 [Burkholderia phage phiE058]NOK49812.1 hypothetical protein [Burkholderia thailandensis]